MRSHLHRRLRLSLGVSLVLLASACQAPPVPPTPGGSQAPAAKPSAAKPGVQPAAGTQQKPQLVRPLGGQAQRLAGRVVIDATYAARFGKSTLVSNSGSTLIGNDGSTLIGNDGSTLIGNDGSTLVLLDGGKLVSNSGSTLIGNDGSTLVSNSGSTLVANASGAIVAGARGNLLVPAEAGGERTPVSLGSDGAALVSNSGSTLVSNSGSTLIGNDGSTYRLAQAPAVAYGQAAPAVGMWVSAVDARTGFTVPIGRDAADQPVYSAYTDAAGVFDLQVPADAAPYVRVVARAPGLRDPRLVMNVLAPQGAAVRVDDAQVAVTGYLRAIVRSRMLAYLGLGRFAVDERDDSVQVARAALKDLKAVTEELKARGLSEAQLDELGLLIADAVLARTKFREATLSMQGIHPRHPRQAAELDGKNMVEELAGVLTRVQAAARTQAQAAGAADPALFFAAKPYVVAANLLRTPATRWRIERPADLTDFMTAEYLASTEPRQADKLFDLYDDLGIDLLDRARVEMAFFPFSLAILSALASEEDGRPLGERLVELIRTTGAQIAKAQIASAPTREAPPLPSFPADPAYRVDTLAGHPDRRATAGAAAIDGPVAAATFDKPTGLALDESGPLPILYVADGGPGTIRRITLDPAGATVATLPGVALPPGGQPRGLLHAGAGVLYLADFAHHAIWRIADGAATVLAGVPGQSGFVDDVPGADARFKSPSGLALAPDGALLVADAENNRIRRVDLADPAHRVSTFAGDDRRGRIEGTLRAAGPDAPGLALDVPTALGFRPDGTLFLVQSSTGSASLVSAPVGPSSRSRLWAGGGVPWQDADGYFHNAWLGVPFGAASDKAGRIVVADQPGRRIRMATTEGRSVTIGGGGPQGDDGPPSFADGDGPQARFMGPTNVVVAADGTIYAADPDAGAIRRLRQVSP